MYFLKYLYAAPAVCLLVSLSGFSPAPAVNLNDRNTADSRAVGRDPAGATALIIAVESGDLDSVARVLDEGASPNESTPDGWTPLMAAAAQGRPDLVRELLAVGADPSVRSRDGWTAMLAAVNSGNEETVLTIADQLRHDRPAWVADATRRH